MLSHVGILIVNKDWSFVFFGPCLYDRTCLADIGFLEVFVNVAVAIAVVVVVLLLLNFI